ncbi:MAG TPA: hypothetical protein VLB76_09980, partial [Thermoanaerobaculia bacterium]|nr:hypothetical protein [Thermoanaerobaculia bacterium]
QARPGLALLQPLGPLLFRTESILEKSAIARPAGGHLASGFLARRLLGKHKAGKGCLYVKRLADIDLAVLAELVTLSVQKIRRRYN